MSDVTTIARPDEEREDGSRGRKLKAFLAGGLVLGVGAAVTFAAWNDSEFTEGSFGSGTFNLEGSTNGTAYADHPASSGAATLNFTVNPTNLSPGDTVSAAFAVRLGAGTTYDADVVVKSAGTTGAVTGLTYELVQTSDFGCQGAAQGTLVPAGTAMNTVPGTPDFDLAKGASGQAGASTYLCFKVSANDSLPQGQRGTATWQFTATSR